MYYWMHLCRTTIRDNPTFLAYSLHRRHVVKRVVLPGLATFLSNEFFFVIVRLPSYPHVYLFHTMITLNTARRRHQHYLSSPQAHSPPSSTDLTPSSQKPSITANPSTTSQVLALHRPIRSGDAGVATGSSEGLAKLFFSRSTPAASVECTDRGR
jgi:hypothetical protein